MEPYSSVFAISAFIVGALTGAALVMLQRHAQIEMIKAQFQQELAAMCEQSSTNHDQSGTVVVRRIETTAEIEEEDLTDPMAEAEPDWITVAPAVTKHDDHHVSA